MPNVVEVNDQKTFQTLKESVQKEAKEDAARGEAGLANRNLHRLEVIRNPHGEPDQGGERNVIVQYDQGYRPNSNRGELADIKFYKEEQLPLMEKKILEERMEYSSSPYVDRGELPPSERRPEENVDAGQDIWSIDHRAEEELGLDVDLLANDVSRTHNAPKLDLDNKAQEGVDAVKERKSGIITDWQQLQRDASQILKDLGPLYQPTGQPALQTKSPMELVDFVDEELEHYLKNYEVNQRKSSRLMTLTHELRQDARQIVAEEEETVEVSRNEMRHTLKQPGFERPSGIGADDAVDDYGVGDGKYLGLI